MKKRLISDRSLHKGLRLVTGKMTTIDNLTVVTGVPNKVIGQPTRGLKERMETTR